MSTQRSSVLILDDNDDLLFLSKILVEEICGKAVITAASFAEVVSLDDVVLACQLAILDINLGANQPNGIDVYRWLRSCGSAARIVFVTGHASNNPLVIEAEQLCDAKVYCKPLASAKLISIVRGEDDEH